VGGPWGGVDEIDSGLDLGNKLLHPIGDLSWASKPQKRIIS
jgi:hypothetical protein